MRPKNKIIAITILANLLLGNLFFPLNQDSNQLSIRIAYSLTAVFYLFISLFGLQKTKSLLLHLLVSLIVTLLIPIVGMAIWTVFMGLDPLRGGLGAVIGIILLWKYTVPMIVLNFFLFYLYRNRS